jgi:acyl carrier protein
MLDKNELFNIISKALKVSKKKINMKLGIGDLEEWDSLGALGILIKLDKETRGKAS